MNKLETVNDGMLLYYCPGCKQHHGIYTDKNRPVHWDFNDNFESPTFSPSILVRMPYKGDINNYVCHSFVRDGKIEFLSDCTHEFAGKTVDMEDVDK